jgi:hypothetical protein
MSIIAIVPGTVNADAALALLAVIVLLLMFLFGIRQLIHMVQDDLSYRRAPAVRSPQEVGHEFMGYSELGGSPVGVYAVPLDDGTVRYCALLPDGYSISLGTTQTLDLTQEQPQSLPEPDALWRKRN